MVNNCACGGDIGNRNLVCDGNFTEPIGIPSVRSFEDAARAEVRESQSTETSVVSVRKNLRILDCSKCRVRTYGKYWLGPLVERFALGGFGNV